MKHLTALLYGHAVVGGAFPRSYGPFHAAGWGSGKQVVFDQVLAILDGENATIGTPTVAGAKVEATVLKNGKGKKIRIFKYNPKKGYRKRQGHRQPYTKVEIKKISA